jgi:hypothetical protein
LPADRATDNQSRKEVSRCYPYGRRGCGKLTLCRMDVWPPAQQIDWQPGRYPRRKRWESAWLCEFSGKLLGKLTEQNRNDVPASRDLSFERCNIRPQSRQKTLC